MTVNDVVVCPRREDVIERVARDAVASLRECLSHKPIVHVVLTGGTVGIGVLNALGYLGPQTLDWGRVHLWWGDERWVPSSSEDRNAGQASPGFLAKLPLVGEQIHRMGAPDSGISLDEAATEYSSQIRAVFDDTAPHFDLTFLGVGPDGHVASLFPHHPDAREDSSSLVVPVRHSPKPPPERLSLTLHALNSSDRVWIVAAGADKAEAVRSAQAQRNFAEAPVSAVVGAIETRLYCDEAASGIGLGVRDSS